MLNMNVTSRWTLKNVKICFASVCVLLSDSSFPDQKCHWGCNWQTANKDRTVSVSYIYIYICIYILFPGGISFFAQPFDVIFVYIPICVIIGHKCLVKNINIYLHSNSQLLLQKTYFLYSHFTFVVSSCSQENYGLKIQKSWKAKLSEPQEPAGQ